MYPQWVNQHIFLNVDPQGVWFFISNIEYFSPCLTSFMHCSDAIYYNTLTCYSLAYWFKQERTNSCLLPCLAIARNWMSQYCYNFNWCDQIYTHKWPSEAMLRKSAYWISKGIPIRCCDIFTTFGNTLNFENLLGFGNQSQNSVFLLSNILDLLKCAQKL